jgi:hypothetical protein
MDKTVKKDNNSIVILKYLLYSICIDSPKEILLYIIGYYDLLFENRSFLRIKEEPNLKHLSIYNRGKRFITREDVYIVYSVILNEKEELKYKFIEKLTNNCYLVTWDQYILFPFDKRVIYAYTREKHEKSFSTSFLIHPCFIYNTSIMCCMPIGKNENVNDIKNGSYEEIHDTSDGTIYAREYYSFMFILVLTRDVNKCRNCLSPLSSVSYKVDRNKYCNTECFRYFISDKIKYDKY